MSGKSIYLVLDMINDLVSADGPNGSSPLGAQVRLRNIIANTQRTLEKVRAAGVAVGYVRVGFSPDYRECPPASPIFSGARTNGIFKLGTKGTEVHSDLAPRPGDFDIVKHRVSPFYGTSLEPILRANGIDTIVMSGVSSVAVLQGTTRDAHDRDYRCIIVEDGCAAATPEEHDAAILLLRRFATITTSTELAF